MTREHFELILQARLIADADYYGDLLPEEIRARAVAAVRGPEAIDGRTVDAIEALFDHMLYERQADPVRRVLAESRARVN